MDGSHASSVIARMRRCQWSPVAGGRSHPLVSGGSDICDNGADNKVPPRLVPLRGAESHLCSLVDGQRFVVRQSSGDTAFPFPPPRVVAIQVPVTKDQRSQLHHNNHHHHPAVAASNPTLAPPTPTRESSNVCVDLNSWNCTWTDDDVHQHKCALYLGNGEAKSRKNGFPNNDVIEVTVLGNGIRNIDIQDAVDGVIGRPDSDDVATTASSSSKTAMAPLTMTTEGDGADGGVAAGDRRILAASPGCRHPEVVLSPTPPVSPATKTPPVGEDSCREAANPLTMGMLHRRRGVEASTAASTPTTSGRYPFLPSRSVAAMGAGGRHLDRPIYPSLPFSPYGSPCSSPRLKRQPLKESRRVSIETHDNYVQLNQYRLKEEIGQVQYGHDSLTSIP